MDEVLLVAVAALLWVLFNRLRRAPRPAHDILQARREAHAAACAGLEDDPLIRAVFVPPPPIAPLSSPLRPGAMLSRQAE